MSKILIYTKPNCPYCDKAKNLLKMKKVINIQEIDISNQEALKDQMIRQSNGRKTVPQIFINDLHIGGFDDLNSLNMEGKLDQLLN